MVTDGFRVTIDGESVVIPYAQILERCPDEYDAMAQAGLTASRLSEAGVDRSEIDAAIPSWPIE
jgi:hypothetical protein